jgi:hypothetical protein
MEPTTIKIKKHVVYSAEEVYKYDQAYFNGCSRIRTIIDKKRLTDDDYIFGYKNEDKWILSNKEYPKAKLLLTKEWVQANVPKFMSDDAEKKYECEEAPPILELTNKEKFQDKDGNILEIEVRGERDPKKCYFRVKDISKGFKLKGLQQTINHDYERNIDYTNFTCFVMSTDHHKTSKKCMFLTYHGVIRVLFTSRTGDAKRFQDWATKTLFTVQMGSEKAKKKLASELIGVSPEAVKAVFDTNSSKTPTVYLFYIGNANKLLNTNEYDKDDILCKYGCTDDLVRRTTEHTKYYQKEFGKDTKPAYGDSLRSAHCVRIYKIEK